MSHDHDADINVSEVLEMTPEVDSDGVTVVRPTICPTCGANRGGATGAPHGCSTVAVIPSKSGGIIYAPTARYCAQCGSKEHRNLPANERLIICLWQQFTAEKHSGEFVTTDRHGVTTEFAPITDVTATEFSAFLASGAAKLKVKKVRGPKAAKPTVSIPATSSPMATAIAEDVNAEETLPITPATKESRKARRERLMQEELARQERESGN